MEWTNRDAQSTQSPAAASTGGAPSRRKDKSGLFKGLRFATVALLFSVTVLIVALAAYAAIGGSSTGESKFVNKKQMQAVFLNGGQVYFGRINDLNNSYLRMSDIYYLRVNQTVQPNQQNNNQAAQNDISLVKLGCELHGPQDEMVIYREQIIFWENLKDDGQVAKAVDEYKKQNPDGQKCDTPSQSTNTNTTPTTPSTPTTPTTPSTNTNRR